MNQTKPAHSDRIEEIKTSQELVSWLKGDTHIAAEKFSPIARDFEALQNYFAAQNPPHPFRFRIEENGTNWKNHLYLPGNAPTLIIENFLSDDARSYTVAEGLRFSMYAALGACDDVKDFQVHAHNGRAPGLSIPGDLYQPAGLLTPRMLIMLDSKIAALQGYALFSNGGTHSYTHRDMTLRELMPLTNIAHKALQHAREPFYKNGWPSHTRIAKPHGLRSFEAKIAQTLETGEGDAAFFPALRGAMTANKNALDQSRNMTIDLEFRSFCKYVRFMKGALPGEASYADPAYFRHGMLEYDGLSTGFESDLLRVFARNHLAAPGLEPVRLEHESPEVTPLNIGYRKAAQPVVEMTAFEPRERPVADITCDGLGEIVKVDFSQRRPVFKDRNKKPPALTPDKTS